MNDKNDKNDQAKEIGRVRRMLRELGQLAEEASLTGSMSEGARAAVRRYNSMLGWLEGVQAVPGGLFPPLGEETKWGELGVEARMLSSYLKDAEEQAEPRHARPGHMDFGAIMGLAPFLDQAELGEMVRRAMDEGGAVNPGMLAGLAPFLDRADLGRIVRESMPQWAGVPHPPHPPHPPHAPHAPHPPHAPEPPTPPEPPAPPEPTELATVAGAGTVSDRLAEVTAQIEAVAQRIRGEHLSEQEITALAQEMARLAAEQSDLARSLAP